MPSEKMESFSGLLSSVLSDGTRLYRFILLTLILFSFVILAIWAGMSVVFSSLSKRGFTSVVLSKSSIKLEAPNMEDEYQFFVLVHPQGLINTQIEVSSGDKLKIQASGKINLRLEDIIKSVSIRKEIEWEIRSENPKMALPESLFDSSHVFEMMKVQEHTWIGPDGDPNTDVSSFYTDPKEKGRAELRVQSDANWGALLTGISASKSISSLPGSFQLIGSEKTIVVKEPGYLCFIINDYLNVPNRYVKRYDPYMYFNNNLGYFWVHITMKKAP